MGGDYLRLIKHALDVSLCMNPTSRILNKLIAKDGKNTPSTPDRMGGLTGRAEQNCHRYDNNLG